MPRRLTGPVCRGRLRLSGHWTLTRVPAITETAAPPGRVAFRGIAILCAVVGAAWVLYRLERLAFVLAMAMFFAYLVAPVVRLAEQPLRIRGKLRDCSRSLAITLVYVVILGGASAGTGAPAPDGRRAVRKGHRAGAHRCRGDALVGPGMVPLLSTLDAAPPGAAGDRPFGRAARRLGRGVRARVFVVASVSLAWYVTVAGAGPDSRVLL